jgi:chitodextrinase
MKVVAKQAGAEAAGETEGARRATGVFPGDAPAAEPPAATAEETEVVAKGTAATLHARVRAADRAGGGPLHDAGRDRRVVAASASGTTSPEAPGSTRGTLARG